MGVDTVVHQRAHHHRVGTDDEEQLLMLHCKLQDMVAPDLPGTGTGGIQVDQVVRRPKDGLSSPDALCPFLRHHGLFGFHIPIVVSLGVTPYHDVFTATVAVALAEFLDDVAVGNMPPGLILRMVLEAEFDQIRGQLHAVGNVDQSGDYLRQMLFLIQLRNIGIGLVHKHHIGRFRRQIVGIVPQNRQSQLPVGLVIIHHIGQIFMMERGIDQRGNIIFVFLRCGKDCLQ